MVQCKKKNSFCLRPLTGGSPQKDPVSALELNVKILLFSLVKICGCVGV